MNASSVTKTDINRLIAASNDFGFKLLSLLVEKEVDKNVFISSFSVAIALAMAYNGADGKTKEAIAETLGLKGLSLQQVNEANAGFMSMQEGLDPKVQFIIANSIWVRNGVLLSPEFVQRAQNYYTGTAASIDFSSPGAADIINKWVADKTHQKIQKLVTPSLVRLAMLILLNAIYFKGIWTNQFDKEKTEARDFSLLNRSHKHCLMMSQSGYFYYYENDKFQAVNLPYGKRRLSMLVFLPKPTLSIGDFQKILDFESWQKWMPEFHLMKGNLLLPRFKVEFAADLLPSLITLIGKEIAAVDFKGMGTGSLQINNVIHKTLVEVNEEGTEAAAATAVVMVRGDTMPEFMMKVDRPFFCAIRNNKTGMLLFMGFVLEPN